MLMSLANCPSKIPNNFSLSTICPFHDATKKLFRPPRLRKGLKLTFLVFKKEQKIVRSTLTLSLTTDLSLGELSSVNVRQCVLESFKICSYVYNMFFDNYSSISITRTLGNLNLPLTRSKTDFS